MKLRQALATEQYLNPNSALCCWILIVVNECTWVLLLNFLLSDY